MSDQQTQIQDVDPRPTDVIGLAYQTHQQLDDVWDRARQRDGIADLTALKAAATELHTLTGLLVGAVDTEIADHQARTIKTTSADRAFDRFIKDAEGGEPDDAR